MAEPQHLCPNCGHRQAATIIVRVEQLDPAALQREIQRQIRKLRRRNES